VTKGRGRQPPGPPQGRSRSSSGWCSGAPQMTGRCCASRVERGSNDPASRRRRESHLEVTDDPRAASDTPRAAPAMRPTQPPERAIAAVASGTRCRFRCIATPLADSDASCFPRKAELTPSERLVARIPVPFSVPQAPQTQAQSQGAAESSSACPEPGHRSPACQAASIPAFPWQHPDRPWRPMRPDSRTFWAHWTHRTDLTPGLQACGLVRDNRVEVRVLFGALSKPRVRGAFVIGFKSATRPSAARVDQLRRRGSMRTSSTR
jgi:hypothetical protein